MGTWPRTHSKERDGDGVGVGVGAGVGSSDPDLSHQRGAGTARSLYQTAPFHSEVGSAPSVPASYSLQK